MGCDCKCLLQNPESDNEMVNGIIPGLGIKSSKKEDLNDIININSDNEEDNNDKHNDKVNTNKENNDNINVENNDKDNMNENKINEENKNFIEKKSLLIQEKEEINKKDDNLEHLKIPKINIETSGNAPKKMISNDSSIMSKTQELYESIFDYFNEIRTEPKKFEKIAEKHGVSDILQKVINDSNPCHNLIINNYYNLLLSTYINDITTDGEDNSKIIEGIEKEEKLKNFNKKLFTVDGDVNEPNDVVWNLIENNKDIAYENFFSNFVECLVISCQMMEKQKFKCYFLFLSKKNLNDNL